jgi:hypothetical protein
MDIKTLPGITVKQVYYQDEGYVVAKVLHER